MIMNIVKTIDGLFRVLLTLLIAVMVASVTWQIISRYFLGAPSSWTEELARFLLIWIGLLGGSYAYHVKMHLGLDIFSAKFTGRVKQANDVFIHCIVILFSATVLVGGGLNLVLLTYELRQYSAALGVPMALIYCSLPISGLMFILYALVALVEDHRDSDNAPGEV